MTTEAPEAPPVPQQLSVANIKLLTGRVVQVAFPPDLSDDELLQLLTEMSGNLRVARRVELAQQSPLVVARQMPSGH